MDLEKGAQELSEDERSSEEESQDDGSIDGEDNGEEDRLPVYYAEDDETIEYIAVKHEVDGKELKLNKRKHVGLTLKANLEEGTEILLPLVNDRPNALLWQKRQGVDEGLTTRAQTSLRPRPPSLRRAFPMHLWGPGILDQCVRDRCIPRLSTVVDKRARRVHPVNT